MTIRWGGRRTLSLRRMPYDAGARTILAWGYYGSASNNYRAQNPLVVRAKTAEAFRRIWDRERDRLRQESRRKLGLLD